MTAVDRLRALVAEVMDLRHAADLVEWDERVCMPPGGAGVHGEMGATLRRLAHEKFTSAEVGNAIEAARREVADDDPDSDAARHVAVAARDFDKAIKVPAAYVAEHARVVSAAQHAWAGARAASAFEPFRPHLDRIVDLKRQYVTFFPGADHPYDPHLDDFEPGMKTADVLRLFAELRPRQVDLVRRLAEHPAPADGFLAAPYSEQAMSEFAVAVVTAFGFDWSRGRQDRSVHPFASAIGAGDVRITTRWVEGQPLALLFGAMHEAGHALYEQGGDPSHHRTLLEGGASLGIHESQSRLWENVIGRSRAFWDHFYPELSERFSTQLAGVDVDRFWSAVNRVRPTLVRVEADEATYNLHVMLRVELEIALLTGIVAVADLPDAWNARMQEYLGLLPPDEATGVLQDIHWSAGLFGYFPTYTLGNVIAAQLWERFGALHPERDADIARGDFRPLLSWLRSELHRHGRKFQPQELVQRVAGAPISPEPYLRYLEVKYAG